MEEGLSNMQVAILKKEYEPFRGKTISAARAKQLMNILDKFKDQDLQKLAKANIPFVSSGSDTKLRVRKMGFKVTTFNPMGSFKEEITQEDFDLVEGKMKTIATMFDQGKSAEEIAKKMKLPVDTVKSILGKEEKELEEKIQPFMISYSKYGKHAGFEDAKSLQDLQTKAQKLRAKGFTIDKMGRYNPPVKKEDKDAFDPITEACWTGYKQVGMKKKGDKMVPNCVPESFKVEEYITEQDDSVTMSKDMKKKKEELPKQDDVGTEADTEKKEKKESDNVDKLKADIEKKDNEIQALKVKAETEKAKVAKKETEKMVNPETGEPLLQVGVAYKHLRDKMAKMKEDVDYLKPKLNPSQIANIKKTWQDKKPGDVTPAVKKMIKNMDIPTQLAIKHADIKFLSKLVEDLGKEDEKTFKPIIKQLKKSVTAHDKQAKDLEKAMKNEADLSKSQIKNVHDKADELPKDDFRDRYGKEKGDSVRYGVATKMVKKKLNIENKNHPAKEVYESIAAVRKKADKSGMPYSILKKVYDRGMAAWRGGHRPGATQVQWALARVNSFVTKSSGTWGGADKDLAKQVRGSK